MDVEESYDEKAEETLRLIGDNPLMERVQEALYKQISNADTRVTLQLRDKEEALRRVKADRELVGVELYGVQQQLAKLQMELENRHNNFNMIAR